MENKAFSSQRHEDGSITISSGKRLSIENANDFAMCLSEALAASQRVDIAFDANAEADITTMQILCSACKTAAAEGKTLTHQGFGTESLRKLVVAIGAENHGICKHNNDNLCIWFGGNDSWQN